MSLVINTNMASLEAQNNLTTSQNSLNTSIERLSSGLRINSAADDASGLAIATGMQSQINGDNQAILNSNNAVSWAQTADGGLAQITNVLQRMRDLAVEGANSTTSNASLTPEFTQLQAEITRISGNTNFNGANTLGAAAAAGLTFQVGADATDQITVTGTDVTAVASKTAIAAGATVKVDTAADSTAAITAIDAALGEVNGARATLGAVENRFQTVISNLQSSVQNQTSAESQIMDADFASETANMTRGQILQQAGVAMVAQANSMPNVVLKLLQ
ncbi:MAG: flagellin [Thiobacillaceae bacterium]